MFRNLNPFIILAFVVLTMAFAESGVLSLTTAKWPEYSDDAIDEDSGRIVRHKVEAHTP